MAEPTLVENLWNFTKQRFKTLELFPDYLKSVIARWNDIFFLSIPALPFVAWWYVGEPPMAVKLIVFLWILVIAGYYAWRTDHMRLIQKMKFADPPFRFHDQSTDTEERHRYLQILPCPIAEESIEGCQGYLLRIMRWNGNGWSPTEFDHAMGLAWSFQRQWDNPETRTLYLGVEQAINILFITSAFGMGVQTVPQNFAIKTLSAGTFRFDLRVVARGCPPIDLNLKIDFGITAGQPIHWQDTLRVEQC